MRTLRKIENLEFKKCVAEFCAWPTGGIRIFLGLGAPVFAKIETELAKAAMSLPATKGFEIGSGFSGTFLAGSYSDEFFRDEHGRIRTRTNRCGGIQGGISNGEIITMRIAYKPTSTIGRKQDKVTRDKHEKELIARGRHDPCVVPRGQKIWRLANLASNGLSQ